MRKRNSIMPIILVGIMLTAFLTGCKGNSANEQNKDLVNNQENNQKNNQEISQENNQDGDNGFREYTAFFAYPGTEITTDNRLMNAIAEVTGGKVSMTWLNGQTASEMISSMIAGGNYPDFIDGSSGIQLLIEAGALIPIDEYWDNYPNIKNFLSEDDWDKIRKEDGHIYFIPQFGVVQGEVTATNQNDEAFWIQKDALIWDNYPKIKTIEDYFDLIYRYTDAHKETNGEVTLGFTVCTEDGSYSGLENPPMMLAGYPNNGVCIVDEDTLIAHNYDTTKNAYQYFKKLNQVYNDGYFDVSAFTDTYNQYIKKISSGRVVGLVDQHSNFAMAEDSLEIQGANEKTYVPLPITLKANIEDHWYSPPAINSSSGLGITVNCKNPKEALQFINDLLSPEVMILRYWGEESVDYKVGEDGVFSRTTEQRSNWQNAEWAAQNTCSYHYFPHFEGMLEDEINSVYPADQPEEFYEALTEADKKVLDAYGYNNYLEFLNTDAKNAPWFPLWTYTNTWTSDTKYGFVKTKMNQIKRIWLPKVIMAPTRNFEGTWKNYQNTLISKADIKAYEAELTAEVSRRVASATNKK